MNNLTDKKWWKQAGNRAIRTVIQSLASTLPVGIVITPAMIQEASGNIVYIVLGWLGTAVLAGVSSLLTSLVAGMPEEEED